MIAVRPPEYFPGLAYTALLAHVDVFVLADTFQYSRQSFQNRARLRNPDGWQWISIPLHGGQHGTAIRAARIDTRARWQKKHWRAFMYNYRSTPYFELYEPTFRPFFEESWETLGAATCASVELIHRLMGLSNQVVRASALPGAPDTLPAIVQAVEADALLSPKHAAAYDAASVDDLAVFHYEEPTYRQNFEGFEPGMTALDVLFNYGPETHRYLEAAEVTQAAL